ncbi:MAG: hypothetical protein ABI967_13595 [bacterium]
MSRLRHFATPTALAPILFLVYIFSNPELMSPFDYTYRIAEAMLHCRLGLVEQPPSWLNEMVHLGTRYYSVFPLGSVLCMMPLALLKRIHVIDAFPAGFVAALIAAISTLFFFLLSNKQGMSSQRRVMLALFPLLGTWTWCNLAYAGAWQLALGFALLGEAGALYFAIVNRRPWLAGLFFAIAFGNRTEVLLTTPIFIYFLVQADRQIESEGSQVERSQTFAGLMTKRPAVLSFIALPFVLGVATLAYNFARFHSVTDFGYMRIPQVASEDLYRHGLFSLYAVHDNARAMLWEGWRVGDDPPYLIPHGFGGSIFLSCPLLLLLLRKPKREGATVIGSWIAILLLTLVLWLHGNPGGWQFSYRYGMILLPWMFLILLYNGGRKASIPEVVLLVLSILINAYATYLFLWTSYVQP